MNEFILFLAGLILTIALALPTLVVLSIVIYFTLPNIDI